MREYAPGRPLVFNHIPKTAGTSLTQALIKVLDPKRFVTGLDGALFGGYDDLDALSPVARASVYLEPDELPADADFVAGHISPATTMRRFPDADHITVLRVPQLRIVSQWLHSRAVPEMSLRHWGSAGNAFRVARLPLADYIRHPMIAPNVDNTLTRFLAWPHPALKKTSFLDPAADDDLVAVASDRLARYAFLNVAENENLLRDFGEWLGGGMPETTLNERSAMPRRFRPVLSTELTDATRELLADRCRLDVRLWSSVVRRALPEADPDALLEESMSRTIARYEAMLAGPEVPLTLRGVTARVWDIGVRVRGRQFDPRPPASA